ncbi:MAG: hypothetical protein JSV03_04220 [Planctomycetota bacterium]|nr:MAG: hypothetical protein JSV03_04220 [Planctomycetota bacterium]
MAVIDTDVEWKLKGDTTAMDFRVNLTIELDQVANGLAVQTPVPIQLVCREDFWCARCENPSFETGWYDTFQEALTAGAEEVALEVHGISNDQPHIIGKITPDSVPIQKL